jgi:hypothetical protein
MLPEVFYMAVIIRFAQRGVSIKTLRAQLAPRRVLSLKIIAIT